MHVPVKREIVSNASPAAHRLSQSSEGLVLVGGSAPRPGDARIRAADGLDVRTAHLIPAAIEETLRYDPSVPVWRRITTRPVTLAGVNLPEGAKLFLWLAAAGRDPSVFHQPGQFDPARPNAAQHLAFGLGLHYCLGANLGKLETRLVLEELARRYPRLRLSGGQQLSFHPNISFRGPQQLRVRTAQQQDAPAN